MTTPTLSIITITYNNINGLKKTIASVSALTFNDYEHIIMDGNSNDGTQAYLKSIDQPTRIWVSEPDKGIYNAMNKGLAIAKGTWVIFMNAGDQFFNANILSDIPFSESSSIIYGQCQAEYATGFKRIIKPLPIEQLWKGMSFSHQSVFVTKKLMGVGFNEKYKYVADFELLFKHFLAGVNFIALQVPICIIDAGGVSDQKRYKATNEVYQINKELNPKFKQAFYFIPKIIKGYITVKIKLILPAKIINRLLKNKYQ
ncbi:glycosyltransferase family 2 protein [Putridiphycobacter roseus]|uniref:glycosyltransferase family 2 protein n=1 Tax=Putridiphycobacter roseus TaxID=2219161 RepID=UPI001314578E|nr:glycosyltransferase family 2 protein [Putridiphycobacter roseus]